MILNHHDLINLGRELASLRDGQVQEIFVAGQNRVVLVVYAKGVSSVILFDLTPSHPFVLKLGSRAVKKKQVSWGLVQFMRARIQGLRIFEVAIQPEPDRRLVFKFQHKNGSSELVFDCFPHGQRIQIFGDGKYFSSPTGEPDPFDWTRAISLEASDSSEFSSRIWETFESARKAEVLKKQSEQGKVLGSAKNAGVQSRLDLLRRQKLKVQKALEGIKKGLDENVLSQGDLFSQWGERLKMNPKLLAAAQEKFPKLLQGKNNVGLALQVLFDAAKKEKRKIEMAHARLSEFQGQSEKIDAEMMGLQEESFGPAQADDELDNAAGLKKETVTPKFSGLRIAIGDGSELWVGRNSQQNEELLKLARPTDTWIHLRDHPGAHGLVRANNPKKEMNPSDVEFACSIVAHFSQGRKNPWVEGEALDFYVVPRKFLKKPKGLGQGKVIVERETVRRVRVKVPQFQILNSK